MVVKLAISSYIISFCGSVCSLGEAAKVADKLDNTKARRFSRVTQRF